MSIIRRPFYSPQEIASQIEKKVEQCKANDYQIDFITFVSDGEPTLDSNLGSEIESLKMIRYPIAVISNASLVFDDEVREELALADWVSLKVDAIQEDTWRKINRPHRKLELHEIMEGVRIFGSTYQGRLVTETMLVAGVNDDEDNLAAIAKFLGEIKPATAYIAVPMRPPAESWVRPPDNSNVQAAYQILKNHVVNVELLVSPENGEFAVFDKFSRNLLSITAVHPIPEEIVFKLANDASVERSVVYGLVERKLLARIEYKSKWYYMRQFPKE